MAEWELVSVQADRDAVGATLIPNTSQIQLGRLGVALVLSPGQSVASG